MGICGCAVTVQPTSGPAQPSSTPYYQPPPSPIEGDVSHFYDRLAPHGEWLQLQNYGWVWTPHSVPLGWRPYIYMGHGPIRIMAGHGFRIGKGVGLRFHQVLTDEPGLTSIHMSGHIRSALWKKGSCLNEIFGFLSIRARSKARIQEGRDGTWGGLVKDDGIVSPAGSF